MGSDLGTGEFGYHELERAALAFVTETETWPVFLEWARVNHASEAVCAWLESGPSLAQARKMWAEHSPDEAIRALAARMP